MLKTPHKHTTREVVKTIFESLDLTKKEIDFIETKVAPVTVKKGAILFKQSNVVDSQYYVFSGCLRAFHIDGKGKEYTLQFAIKDWWISDYIAYFGNRKGVLNIECISDAILYKIHKSDVELIYSEVPCIEQFFRKKLEKAFVRHEKRILANLTSTAKERYRSFLKTYPNIEKHLKNYHIASYLGITTESLSRIRKEV